VYILQIPLLQPTVYQLCKFQPFPLKQQENVFVYIATKKDFIFTDAMRKIWQDDIKNSRLVLRLMLYHVYVKKMYLSSPTYLMKIVNPH